MKTPIHLRHVLLRDSAALGLSWLVLAPLGSLAQLTPAQIDDLQNVAADRVEAFTVLGGDYGVAGGTYIPDASGRDVKLSVSKFGGWGDIGDPKPLGDTGIGWQPRLQGTMGYVESTIDYKSGQQDNDTSTYRTFAIAFGGGARFWFNDHLSLAPTFMGMYGHSENDYDADSAWGKANLEQAKKAGLVNYRVDTWSVRPGADLQYVYTWGRTVFSLSSELAYYHTESFRTSTYAGSVNGDSQTWQNLIDVDIPLGKELWGHELRTGGFFSRTELYGDVKDGLNANYINEAHGRVVLDFLGKLWKVQWIGVGASYLWGNDFYGYSFGADIAFRF